MQDNKTITAMVLVEAGSRYEDKSENGISHFLEHMCFKGTKNRSSALEIATEFESMGAQFNAFTSGNYTGYYGKVANHKSKEVIEIVSDLYLNATLPESEIEKEKGVIIEEINRNQDNPSRVVWDVFESLVYGDHPLGRTVIGTKDTVSSFTANSLHEYRNKHYTAEKTIVVVAGGINQEEVIKQIEEMFGKIPSRERLGFQKYEGIQSEPKVMIRDKNTDQTRFVIGYRSFDVHDERVYAASVLRTILGGGMSSRLFHRIREELGLCYSISAGHSLELDCGVFTISAGVSNKKLTDAIREINKVISDFLREGPTEAEIQKAKDFKIGHVFLGLEASDDLADWYGFQEMDQEPIITPDEYESKIRSVTREQIMEVAKFIFEPHKANIAVLGPQTGIETSLLSLF